ncbi:TetR/AcrR family transcriptional regulator [Planctomycetota bacterium]|nr:TetR/AcrR family transcriptional regulator [Planctomycetota bacterium]
MAKPQGPNKDNLERTRLHLLEVARELFAEHGYAKTSTTMIIDVAKSSRGSLYHHFEDKRAIFKAVYEGLCEQMSERLMKYAERSGDDVDDLIDGCTAYLKVFEDQAFAHVLLVDGPHVLGSEYCRSKDAENAYGVLYEGVCDIVGKNRKAMMTADFLSGALDTYALRIALAKDRKKVYREYAKHFKVLARGVLECGG